MSVLFQKASLSDKSLNLANFNRMVDYVGRLANMTSPNMMIDRNPNGYVLKVLPGKTVDNFPWEKCNFGYRLNYTSPNLGLVYPSPTGFPWVVINSGGMYNSTGATPAFHYSYPPDTQYIEPYLKRGKAFVLRTGETVIFLRMEGITPFICSGPAVWDPTNSFFTVASYYTNIVDGTVTDTTNLTDVEKSTLKVLYKFTVEASTATPPVRSVNEDLTVVCRFLDVDLTEDSYTPPDGTKSNPHLVWDHVNGEWVIGVIVPPGSETYPHLIWNHDTLIWEAGKLWTLPQGGDTPCVAIWSPEEDEWIALSMETTPYKVLSLDSGGSPIIDYVRWV
jgi:hypothetical protein